MTAPAPGVTLQTPRPIASLRDIAAHPGLQPLLLQQARRGVVTQLAVRVVLAALVVITVLVLPSATQRVPSTALAFGYLAWSVALAGLAGTGARDVRAVSRAWPALLADLVAVTALTVVAGLEAVSWTATVLTYAFFVVPVLAATQLRPWLCAGVCVPTVAAYFAAGVVARQVNGDEPWWSIVLRTAVLARVCAGAVASCRIQLARVIGLARLAADRIELAEQLLTIEERERRDLSEQLHDGAPMGVGARWSTSIAPPVLVMDAGTGRPGGTETVNVWSMPAGSRAPAFRVTSIQTILLSEAASSVACFACPASGDMDAFSASPERACNASPPAVSRTPTVVTVTGTGNPLVSSSS